MRFLMFVCVDPAADPFDPAHDNIDEWVASHDRSGVRIMGNRLDGLESARTVRVRKDKLLVTDGPFAETKEWIAGFDLLECDGIEMAVRVAARHPMARFGRIEVRPLAVED